MAYFQNRYVKPISGLGGSILPRYAPIQGMGAYFQNRYVKPISGLGAGPDGIGCACVAGLGDDDGGGGTDAVGLVLGVGIGFLAWLILHDAG
jgi:hypothetical protein